MAISRRYVIGCNILNRKAKSKSSSPKTVALFLVGTSGLCRDIRVEFREWRTEEPDLSLPGFHLSEAIGRASDIPLLSSPRSQFNGRGKCEARWAPAQCIPVLDRWVRKWSPLGFGTEVKNPDPRIINHSFFGIIFSLRNR